MTSLESYSLHSLEQLDWQQARIPEGSQLKNTASHNAAQDSHIHQTRVTVTLAFSAMAQPSALIILEKSSATKTTRPSLGNL